MTEAERQALEAEAMGLPPSAAVQDIGALLGSAGLTPGTNFDSIDFTQCCTGGSQTQLTPPDPEHHLVSQWPLRQQPQPPPPRPYETHVMLHGVAQAAVAAVAYQA